MAGDVTARGVYKNLEKSPYEAITPYGDILKFPSKKKQEVFGKRLVAEMNRLDGLLTRNGLINHIDPRTMHDLVRGVYLSVYRATVK